MWWHCRSDLMRIRELENQVEFLREQLKVEHARLENALSRANEDDKIIRRLVEEYDNEH